MPPEDLFNDLIEYNNGFKDFMNNYGVCPEDELQLNIIIEQLNLYVVSLYSGIEMDKSIIKFNKMKSADNESKDLAYAKYMNNAFRIDNDTAKFLNKLFKSVYNYYNKTKFIDPNMKDFAKQLIELMSNYRDELGNIKHDFKN